MQKEYTDMTPFPFGKYKNKPIANVPAEYLLWCLQNITNLAPGITNYINSNMQVLQQEISKHSKK